MEEVYHYLEKKMNYDVVSIIRNITNNLNHRLNFIDCMDQIKSIDKEYKYLIWAYTIGSKRYPPTRHIYKFILILNRNKILLNKSVCLKNYNLKRYSQSILYI